MLLLIIITNTYYNIYNNWLVKRYSYLTYCTLRSKVHIAIIIIWYLYATIRDRSSIPNERPAEYSRVVYNNIIIIVADAYFRTLTGLGYKCS